MPGVGASPHREKIGPRIPSGRSTLIVDTFAAFTAEKADDGFRRGLTELTVADLPADGVLVASSGRA